MYYNSIKLDLSRDSLFSEQGMSLMSKYYSDGKEGVQKAIARAAYNFSYGDDGLAQRIYDYASKQWMFFSSPILSNAVEGEWSTRGYKDAYEAAAFWEDRGEPLSPSGFWQGELPKAMPIACFLTSVEDSIKGQVDTASELAYLSVLGGGTAVHNQIRAISDKAPGPIPWIKTVDGIMGYYRQGKTRRGSTAVYMDVSHPDILEFINMRTPTGGDSARKIDNRQGVHLAVNISRAFKEAEANDLDWELICPHTKEVRDTVKARDLWSRLLYTRELTGEPYLYFIDVANDAAPEFQKEKGLFSNGSNLCNEITLSTSHDRTAVCCLSSLNLEYYEEWKDTTIVEDMIRFLDNVIEWFVYFAPEEISKAKKSAAEERAIGLGAMGWHNFLMKNNIPFESGGFNSAAMWNHRIFSNIKSKALEETKRLATERGEPEDCIGTGLRNSHLLAIAPNANSSILCNTSPSIEPISSNAYTQKTRAGIFLVKNKYLKKLLKELGKDTDEVWTSIVKNNGSVMHLDFLTEDQKEVFKTAWEIDQRWVVEHAGQRAQYLCQSQSLNVFFAPGSDRRYINQVHTKAMREELVKGMYYFRTGSEQVADTVRQVQRAAIKDWEQGEDEGDCLSCQG